jgi:hypothetical protein
VEDLAGISQSQRQSGSQYNLRHPHVLDRDGRGDLSDDAVPLPPVCIAMRHFRLVVLVGCCVLLMTAAARAQEAPDTQSAGPLVPSKPNGGWPAHTLGAPSVTSVWSRVGCECDGLGDRHAGPMVEKP